MDSNDKDYGKFPFSDEESQDYKNQNPTDTPQDDDDDFFPTWQRKSFLEQAFGDNEKEEEDDIFSSGFSYEKPNLDEEEYAKYFGSDEDDSANSESLEEDTAYFVSDAEETASVFGEEEESQPNLDEETEGGANFPAQPSYAEVVSAPEEEAAEDVTEETAEFIAPEAEENNPVEPLFESEEAALKEVDEPEFDAEAEENPDEAAKEITDETSYETDKTSYEIAEEVQEAKNSASEDYNVESESQNETEFADGFSVANADEEDLDVAPMDSTDGESIIAYDATQSDDESAENVDVATSDNAENVDVLLQNNENSTETAVFTESEVENEAEEDSAEISVFTAPEDESIAKAVTEPQSVTISSDLIRGHINTIILRALSEGDRYGLEIIQEIERKTHGQYTIKQPTLYSSLKRLENSGYITSYWGTGETNGGRRRYYALTENGKKVTDQNRAEWEYSRTIIDNLISDRAYDLSSTPPTSVDFSLLKNATTRVYGADKVDRSAEKEEAEKELSSLEERREDLRRKMEEEQDALDRLKLQRDELNTEIARTREETRVIEQEQAMRLEELAQQNAEIAELKRTEEELTIMISQKQEYANSIPSITEYERAERDYKNILGRIFPEQAPEEQEAPKAEETAYYSFETERSAEHSEEKQESEPYQKYPDFWSFEEETPQNDHNFATQEESVSDFTAAYQTNSSPRPETEAYERNGEYSEFIRLHTETAEERKRREAISEYSSTPKRRQGKIDFSDIFAFADRNQMRVRSYVGNKTASNQTQKNSLLFINKLRALSMCIVYLVMMAELALCYFLTADLVGLKNEFFYTGLAFTVIPLFAITLLLFASQKLVVPRWNAKDALLTTVIVIFNLFLILIVIALILEVQLSSTKNLLLYFAYPLILSLNLPVYVLIKNAIYKTGKFNTVS